MPHSLFAGDWKEQGWTSGIGVASRWTIVRHEERPLPGDGDAAGAALFAGIDGPRGPLQVFVAMLDSGEDAEASVIVNPVITPADDRLVEGWEGCLSIPDVRGRVPRSARSRCTRSARCHSRSPTRRRARHRRCQG